MSSTATKKMYTQYPINNTKGEIDELGTAGVYRYGVASAVHRYPAVTNNIYAYVTRTIGVDGGNMVLGIYNPPKAPERPKKKGNREPDEWDVLDYKQDRAAHLQKIEKYKEAEGTIISILFGQCDPPMQNKLENITNPCTWEEVLKERKVSVVVSKIKAFTYETESIEYDHWILAKYIKKLLSLRHHPDEDLTTYYKKWNNIVETLEGKWGTFVPTNLSTATNTTEIRGKFLACLFMVSIDTRRYGTALDEINNTYLSGQTNVYPITPEDVINRLTHRSNLKNFGKKNLADSNTDKNNNTKDKDSHDKDLLKEGAEHTSFATTGKTEHPNKHKVQNDKKADEWFQGFTFEY
jgi:hypothetical protein